MVIVAGKARFRPETLEQVKALAGTVIPATRCEEGCLHYAFYPDPEDPAAMFVFEQYRDRAAMEAHMAAPYTQEFLGRIMPLVAEPPALLVYEVSGSRPLMG